MCKYNVIREIAVQIHNAALYRIRCDKIFWYLNLPYGPIALDRLRQHISLQNYPFNNLATDATVCGYVIENNCTMHCGFYFVSTQGCVFEFDFVFELR